MNDISHKVKSNNQYFDEAKKKSVKIMCHNIGNYISNLEDVPQLSHQPVMQKILHLGAPDLSLMSGITSEVKSTVEFPNLQRKEISPFHHPLLGAQPQISEAKMNDSESKITARGMDHKLFSHEMQQNFDHLRLNIQIPCCRSEDYNSFIHGNEKVMSPNKFSAISSKGKFPCPMMKSKYSIQMESKCHSTSLPCALYEEPVPKELEVACADCHSFNVMKNPKFCKYSGGIHVPDNVHDDIVHGSTATIHRQNDGNVRSSYCSVSSGFKNDQSNLIKIDTYRSHSISSNAFVGAESLQKMNASIEDVKDCDLNGIGDMCSLHANLNIYQEDRPKEMVNFPDKFSLNEAINNKETVNTESTILVDTLDSFVSSKMKLSNENVNLHLVHSKRNVFNTEKSNIQKHVSAQENFLSAPDIFDYLRKQDEKILAMQNQVSHLLAYQTNDRGTCNKTVCQQMHSEVFSEKLSLIDSCSSTLQYRNSNKCSKEVLEENFHLLKHFKAQNEQIKQLQDQINLLLDRAHEEPHKSKSFITVEACEKNAHTCKSLSGKINPDDKILKNFNNGFHDAQEDIIVEITSMENSKSMKACSTSSLPNFTFNNDNKLFCSEVLASITGVSKYENDCYHSFPKYLQHRSKAQLSGENCAHFSEIGVEKAKNTQTFISAKYSSLTDELNDLSLAYKCVPVKDSVSLTDSIHLDFKHPDGSFCCENNEDCSICTSGGKGNEIMEGLTKDCSIASVYDDLLMNVNNLILEQNHQCQNKATLLSYRLSTALKVNVSCMTSIISEGKPCTCKEKLSSEISPLLKSSYTSVHHVQGDEIHYVNNVSHQMMSSNKQGGGSNVTLYGLSSPNMSLATKDYLENYGLVHSKLP